MLFGVLLISSPYRPVKQASVEGTSPAASAKSEFSLPTALSTPVAQTAAQAAPVKQVFIFIIPQNFYLLITSVPILISNLDSYLHVNIS